MCVYVCVYVCMCCLPGTQHAHVAQGLPAGRPTPLRHHPPPQLPAVRWLLWSAAQPEQPPSWPHPPPPARRCQLPAGLTQPQLQPQRLQQLTPQLPQLWQLRCWLHWLVWLQQTYPYWSQLAAQLAYLQLAAAACHPCDPAAVVAVTAGLAAAVTAGAAAAAWGLACWLWLFQLRWLRPLAETAAS